MPNSLRIVTLGDSVPWGQGLLESEKYDVLVKQALEPQCPGGVTLEPRLAHSGAVIRAKSAPANGAAGEVPESYPTIIEQCAGFTNSPETVDLVLMNGGINDVGVATILNPLAFAPSLASRIEAACYDSMLELLKTVRAKFSNSSCRILVTGYYPILSALSDPVSLPRILNMYGVHHELPDFFEDVDILDPIVDRCEQFFQDSTNFIQEAIQKVNDPRIAFVPSGFTEENAAFVPHTALLFGLNDELGPEDPVAPVRHSQCALTFGEPSEIFKREQCYRASAGHPNPDGAIKFKAQILAALAAAWT
jgi:hypothetical protein